MFFEATYGWGTLKIYTMISDQISDVVPEETDRTSPTVCDPRLSRYCYNVNY